MKNKFKTLFCLTIIGVMFFSINACKKDNNVKIQTNSTANLSRNEEFRKVAKVFNEAKKSPDLKTKITQTYKKIGIEEFLLNDFLKTKNSTGIDLRATDELEAVNESNPMITIAYPSYAFFNESFEDHLSKIDYTVILFDDIENVKALEAFDSNGNTVNISTQFDESKRYCVIKYNEGKMAIDPSSGTTYFGDNVPKSIYNIQPKESIGKFVLYTAADFLNASFEEDGNSFIDPNIGVDLRGSDPCNLPCERDCIKKKDELHKVKWSSKDCVKNVESGFHLPQVEMIAIYGIPRYQNGTASVDLVAKDVFIHWKDMTTKFSDPLGLEIATWTPDLGDRWQVLWIERDYWNKVQDKFTLGFTAQIKASATSNTTVGANLAWEVTSMKQDKEIGRSLIEYCDKAKDDGETYKPLSCGGSGGFFFQEHVRQ